MKKSLLITENALILFIAIMLFGAFTSGTQAILNIAAVLSLVLIIVLALHSPRSLYKHGNILYQQNKLLLLSLIVFILWSMICILFFTYKDQQRMALFQLCLDWRYALIVLFAGIILYHRNSSLQKAILISFISTLGFIVFISPLWQYFKVSDLPYYLSLRDGFAFYVVMLAPFLLTWGLRPKVKWYIYGFSVFTLLGAFLYLAFAGSRGGMLSLLLECLLGIFLLAPDKKTACYLCGKIIIGMLLILLIAYLSFPQTRDKVRQSLHEQDLTSGRITIVATRYPMIMNSIPHYLHGIGYDGATYSLYLNDHHAPPAYIFKREGNYIIYSNDEPIFIRFLYNLGFIGLALFLWTLITMILVNWRNYKAYHHFFALGLLLSAVGYYLVFCQFEAVRMPSFFMLLMITLLTNKSKEHEGAEGAA